MQHRLMTDAAVMAERAAPFTAAFQPLQTLATVQRANRRERLATVALAAVAFVVAFAAVLIITGA